MKVYTIIDTFSIESGVLDSWVAHYEKKEDLVVAFRKFMERYELLKENDMVDISMYEDKPVLVPTKSLVDELISNGTGFSYTYGADEGTMFLRAEELQTEFNPDSLPF